MTQICRIAMWSGPRNISTAMMRAFENRPDTHVIDEPFYAAYLQATGIDHPMREAILNAQPTNPAEVAAALLGGIPAGKTVFYQKHMTHHMLPGFDLGWMAQCMNVFLIRSPERVITSYRQKRENPTLDDLGFARQAELFRLEADRLGRSPPVIDSDDVLADPRAVLTRLCAVLRIPFSENMLSWPAGRRASDGVWAPHWYHAVEASTGFASPLPVPCEHSRLADEARPHYELLHGHRIHC
jgi:hypothetical protein